MSDGRVHSVSVIVESVPVDVAKRPCNVTSVPAIQRDAERREGDVVREWTSRREGGVS